MCSILTPFSFSFRQDLTKCPSIPGTHDLPASASQVANYRCASPHPAATSSTSLKADHRAAEMKSKALIVNPLLSGNPGPTQQSWVSRQGSSSQSHLPNLPHDYKTLLDSPEVTHWQQPPHSLRPGPVSLARCHKWASQHHVYSPKPRGDHHQLQDSSVSFLLLTRSPPPHYQDCLTRP